MAKSMLNAPHETDLKDIEVYPEPKQFHKIKCRLCKKTKTVKTKYYLRCNECREEHRTFFNTDRAWQQWSNKTGY